MLLSPRQHTVGLRPGIKSSSKCWRAWAKLINNANPFEMPFINWRELREGVLIDPLVLHTVWLLSHVSRLLAKLQMRPFALLICPIPWAQCVSMTISRIMPLSASWPTPITKGWKQKHQRLAAILIGCPSRVRVGVFYVLNMACHRETSESSYNDTSESSYNDTTRLTIGSL